MSKRFFDFVEVFAFGMLKLAVAIIAIVGWAILMFVFAVAFLKE